LTIDAPSEEENVWPGPPGPGQPDPQIVTKFAEAASAIVSAEHVRAADAADDIGVFHPQLVVRPANERELGSVLKLANDAGLAVTPRGGGTKRMWRSKPERVDVVVSLERLNQIEEHAWADLTVTVQAGCTLRDLQRALARHGQRLALDALWPEQATVGGVLSANDSGALRLRFGALRDLVIGVTLALADGTVAKSGGKVVKNVAGYDLPKLVTGAFGALGVITRAVFRLHPVPRESRTISIGCDDLQDAQRVVNTVLDSTLVPSAMQVRSATGTKPVVDVLFEGTSAGVTAQVEQVKTLLPMSQIAHDDFDAWSARQRLLDNANGDERSCMIQKVCVLPTEIAKQIEPLERFSDRCPQSHYEAVMQATGIGCLGIWGDDGECGPYSAFFNLFPRFIQRGGSMTTQYGFISGKRERLYGMSRSLPDLAAHEVMKRVKQQFDPRGTLNP
jgi:glycolate oxidase FAD binding subunit